MSATIYKWVTGIEDFISDMEVMYKVYAKRARERRELAHLSDRLLKDIGITRSEVLNEASKPFWRK